MTRGSVATARGDLAAAVLFNPVSPLVPLGGVSALGRWAYGWYTGRWVSVRYARSRTSLTLGSAAATALWVNQQMNTDLLGG